MSKHRCFAVDLEDGATRRVHGNLSWGIARLGRPFAPPDEREVTPARVAGMRRLIIKHHRLGSLERLWSVIQEMRREGDPAGAICHKLWLEVAKETGT